VAGVFFAALVLSVPAQEAFFRVDVDLVNIPVQVTAADGALIRDLDAADFELLDNGDPRPVDKVWLDTDLPLTIGILLDVSDSQGGQAAEQRRALAAFFEELLRPEDRAFVVAVGMDVTLAADLTASAERLSGAVETVLSGAPGGSPLGEQCPKRSFPPPPAGGDTMIVSACGGTALWNGAWAAIRYKLAGAPGRKALLILSDGVDTGSTRSLKETLAEAHRGEVVVYAIKYPRHPRARGVYGLQRLAEETGGVQYLAGQTRYEDAFRRIAGDLRSQDVLSLRPGLPPGTHRVEVRVRRPGARVRARSAYVRSPLP